MTIIRRNESLPVLSGFLNDFLRNDWLDFSNRNFSMTNTTIPSVNIKESNDGFDLEMAAPGLGKSDFKITTSQGILKISSEKKNEVKENSDNEYSRREFSYESFCRTFTLPDSADLEKISAKYENGILLVSIPKKQIQKSANEQTIMIE